MFTPVSMRHVSIQILKEDLPRASLALAESGAFHPDRRPLHERELPRVPGQAYRQVFHRAATRLDKITRLTALAAPRGLPSPWVVEQTELEALDERLGRLWAEASTFEAGLHEVEQELHLIGQLEAALENFADLDLDLGLLHDGLRFMDLRIGLVPPANLPQLQEALGLSGHLAKPFRSTDEAVYVLIVGPKAERGDPIQSVLDAAGYRPLPLPPELRDAPDRARADLHRRRKEQFERRRRLQDDLHAWARTHADELERAHIVLALARPFVDLADAARGDGWFSLISGWVPEPDLARIRETLADTLDHPHALEARPPHPDERPFVPSIMPRVPWLAPFVTLVRQYGIPRYGEVDPTLLFTASFILMFGMMFGDLGQGLVFMGLGWALRRRIGPFTHFMLAAGASSALFGLLYGSVFGYEHILPALWISPMSDPMYMLGVALIWGIGFICLGCLIAIRNRIVLGDWRDALFGNNGAVALAFYLSLLAGGLHLAREGSPGALPAAVGGGALALLAWHKWREFEAPLGERILVVFIELFETFTGYVSNTLSFLRLAAFALNHVALAVAVFTLADMMQTTGHWITVVLGNVFILVLEGGIVVIQTLRLEYYEGFSRFFSGDGHPFRPLRLST